MYKKGFISVIVPVYNVEKYLRQCLDSIINQTYKNLDIILVDDGSTDNSGSICDEYAEKDSRIRVIHKENGGLSSARNAGLDFIEKEGGGEFLAYVDSDDFLELDIYEKCIDKFCKFESTDLVIFRHVNYPAIYTDKSEQFYEDKDSISNDYILSLYESMLINPAVWNKMFRYDKIKNLRFPNGRVYEDVAYMYRSIMLSNMISTMSYIGYFYRIDNNASISNTIKNNIIDLFINLEELRQYFIDNKYDKKYIIGVNNVILTVGRQYLSYIIKLPIYNEFWKVINRTKRYPLKSDLSIITYIRFKILIHSPRLFLLIDKFMYLLRK